MFNTISWPQYLGGLFVLLVLYYGYVVAVYYRTEVSALLRGKVTNSATSHATAAALLERDVLVPKVAAVITSTTTSSPASVPDDLSGEADANPTAITIEVQSPTPLTATLAEPGQLDSNAAVENRESGPATPVQGDNDLFILDHEAVRMDEQPAATGAAEAEAEEYNQQFTVDVEQLASYLEQVNQAAITPEEVVRQIPALENTGLLLAFYKTSTKHAQQLASVLYQEEAEPA